MQGSQPFHQLQMLTPQHQQQLMLAQQNMTSPSASDMENRRLRMLLNNRSMSMGKDGLANSVGDVSALQAGMSVLPRGDSDILMKVLFVLLNILIFYPFLSWRRNKSCHISQAKVSLQLIYNIMIFHCIDEGSTNTAATTAAAAEHQSSTATAAATARSLWSATSKLKSQYPARQNHGNKQYNWRWQHVKFISWK